MTRVDDEADAKRNRVWPSLLAGIVIMPLTGLTSSQELWFASSQWFLGFIALVGLLHISLALGAAALSRRPTLERLGLVPARLPRWAYPMLALSCPIVGMLSGVLAALLPLEPGPPMVRFLEMIKTAVSEPGPLGVLSILILSASPAFTEETLFRGFIQRGLLRRWSPRVAIGVTSVLFALGHGPRALEVLLSGVWYGVVAWRIGSIWPAVACHFVNNLIALSVFRMEGELPPLVGGLVGGVSGLALYWSVEFFRRLPSYSAVRGDVDF